MRWWNERWLDCAIRIQTKLDMQFMLTYVSHTRNRFLSELWKVHRHAAHQRYAMNMTKFNWLIRSTKLFMIFCRWFAAPLKHNWNKNSHLAQRNLCLTHKIVYEDSREQKESWLAAAAAAAAAIMLVIFG